MFREMYVRDNVVSAKCFSGKCNFWKVFFGEVYRIQKIINSRLQLIILSKRKGTEEFGVALLQVTLDFSNKILNR